MNVLHVVLVEWTDTATDTDTDAHEARAEAERLVDRHLPSVPGIIRVDHGPSSSPEGLEDGFDWALVVRFADAAARDAYLPHPEHAPVARHLRGHSRRILVYDLDVPNEQ